MDCVHRMYFLGASDFYTLRQWECWRILALILAGESQGYVDFHTSSWPRAAKIGRIRTLASYITGHSRPEKSRRCIQFSPLISHRPRPPVFPVLSAPSAVWIETSGLALPGLLSYSSVQETGFAKALGRSRLPPLPRQMEERYKD